MFYGIKTIQTHLSLKKISVSEQEINNVILH